jgi:hypothetical protein
MSIEKLFPTQEQPVSLCGAQMSITLTRREVGFSSSSNLYERTITLNIPELVRKIGQFRHTWSPIPQGASE